MLRSPEELSTLQREELQGPRFSAMLRFSAAESVVLCSTSNRKKTLITVQYLHINSK